MQFPLFSIVAMSLCLCACTPQPEWYAPPMQRDLAPANDSRGAGRMISMDDLQVDSFIVGGLLGNDPGSKWRWANQRAEVRMQLEEKRNMKFFIDFAIADATFSKTGPVTMRFFIDGKPFASVRYDKPGEKHFEAAVDEKLLTISAPITIAAEVDKVFVSPSDGMKLGFMLIRLGFKQ